MTDAQTEKDETKATALEVLDSVTGYDEAAIRNRFGVSVEVMFDRSPGRELPRALAFVLHRRDGLSEGDAYDRAMGATLAEVGDLFAEDTPEVDPDEPETPAGKDASKPAKKPSTSRASSS